MFVWIYKVFYFMEAFEAKMIPVFRGTYWMLGFQDVGLEVAFRKT